VITHLVWVVTAGIGVAETKLSTIIHTPALHGVVIEQRTGMCGSSSDRLRRTTGSKIEWR
jgi:Na+/citrate or Na+/malate symporter